MDSYDQLFQEMITNYNRLKTEIETNTDDELVQEYIQYKFKRVDTLKEMNQTFVEMFDNITENKDNLPEVYDKTKYYDHKENDILDRIAPLLLSYYIE